MPSCYECKTRAQGPWSSLHRLFPNNAASLEASAVMTVEKKRAAEISQRPAPALNEPRKLHCNPNCGSWASAVELQKYAQSHGAKAAIQLYAGQGHYLDGATRTAVLNRTLAFFDEALKLPSRQTPCHPRG